MGRAVVVVFAVAVVVRVAAAAPIRLQVSGDACSFDALEAQLELAGSEPLDTATLATVRIDVTEVAHAYEAQIFFDDGYGAIRGPRTVAAKTCTGLVSSVALVVSMGLQDEPARTTEPTPRDPPVEATPVTATEAWREPTPRRGAPVMIDVFAGGGGGLTSHGLSGQLIIGARVRRGVVSLDAAVRADAPEQVAVAAMAMIEVRRAQLSLGPCLHAGTIAGCMIVSVGAFHGSSDGLTSARSVYSLAIAGGARATWERSITERVALRLYLGVDALLTTTVFDVDGMQVWRSPRIEASTGIGVLARFP